jgi:hypothetical protein
VKSVRALSSAICNFVWKAAASSSAVAGSLLVAGACTAPAAPRVPTVRGLPTADASDSDGATKSDSDAAADALVEGLPLYDLRHPAGAAVLPRPKEPAPDCDLFESFCIYDREEPPPPGELQSRTFPACYESVRYIGSETWRNSPSGKAALNDVITRSTQRAHPGSCCYVAQSCK